ncbi:putative universal ribosomal protein uL22 family protein [Teratosphaeria destructans]|uniref:Universal ribosomal protein uL22 family protein n=1 Tax=Teratosphaeria destructans TaxID=418781 RepID=A0A9W7SXR9_9PEZI|nr:putative universal ribosomal protein uL22 family protein [Teratosphaeria destructans]
MSIAGPSRRAAGRCLFCQTLPIRARVALQTRRAASNDSKSDGSPGSNPILEEYQRKYGSGTPSRQGTSPLLQERPRAGDLAASSIFEDERRVQQQQQAQAGVTDAGETQEAAPLRDPANMARVLDPDPAARERWERKKVIQMVRREGRLTKQQIIKRTEREHLAKTHHLKTSVKKLGMLARQIAGKTIDDAIVQMRFSKKKMAQEVLKHLEYARDEAIVTRGMGLGAVGASNATANMSNSPASISGTVTPGLDPQAPGPVTSAIQIKLKDGKRHTVTDASQIYIDQAWVGRGPFGQLPDFRARGRAFVMQTPWTSLTVVLKEEATRIREHEDREAKRRKQMLDNVWVHLPDRPVQWQRQWYTF